MADHSSHLAHHFADLEQQEESLTLGMWLFLVTEVMFFGGLFAVYTVYRTAYPGVFAEGSHHLDVILGTVNTAILLTSSFTMALAVREAQLGRRKALFVFLLCTVVLALSFLGVKAIEYGHKIHRQLVPGLNFSYTGPHARPLQLFFGLYFVMTGCHALHIIIGIVLMMVMMFRAHRGLTATGVHIFGLYWHFVDIVWIFLFPLLYLIPQF